MGTRPNQGGPQMGGMQGVYGQPPMGQMGGMNVPYGMMPQAYGGDDEQTLPLTSTPSDKHPRMNTPSPSNKHTLPLDDNRMTILSTHSTSYSNTIVILAYFDTTN